MNVILLSPGYPGEMPSFTRGLADAGANVYGVGDQPRSAVPPASAAALHDYLQVRTLWEEDQLISDVSDWLRGTAVDRVECLWEPGMLLAARLREYFETAGLDHAQTLPFRDKEEMKKTLDAAGIRTPRHRRESTIGGCLEAAEEIGFPVIIKPIDGAGSQDTHRVEDEAELRDVLGKVTHVPIVSVEEFIDGEEFTFDAISVNGEPRYFNVAWYRPRPLVARSNEWISPQVIALRDVDDPELAAGIKMGHEVLRALEFENGFTHMEWYRTTSGEVVFGEIGARPPGAHQVDQMKYACDFDVFREWGRSIVGADVQTNFTRSYNVATVYKRAQGEGRIQKIQGLESLESKFQEHIVWKSLLPTGAHRRNWRQTLVSDGFLMLRHPELNPLLDMADEIGRDLQLIAG